MSFSSSAPMLQGQGLSRTVEGRKLWHDLSFGLWAGERLGVIGPSGSGKSLLLRTLAGLDALETGELRFYGQSLHNWDLPVYRARVVYLHQRPSVHEATPEQAFRAPFSLKSHRDKTYATPRALYWLQALGRDPAFLKRPGSTLSGGESQIVAVVRALLLTPDILLLDEPTASLDPETAAAVESAVQLWQQENPDRACIWTSHDKAQIQRLTTRTLDLGGFA
ncbi:MAG: ABC transporter ATP-binding protein [Thermodesulfobacteriota bacterium]